MSSSKSPDSYPPSGTTKSLWNETAIVSRRGALEKSSKVDVCVVGAGIAGLTTAYLCLKAGKSVIVLERSRIASGDTGRTSAHLSDVIDDGLAHIERLHGREKATAIRQSHADAISEIERIARAEGIDCDFQRVDGVLFDSTEDGSRASELKEEAEAARRLGYDVSEAAAAAPDLRGPRAAGGALRIRGQARFHVNKYLKGLADAVERLGGVIHEETPVATIEHAEKEGDTEKVRTVAGSTVQCAYSVEASNSLITGDVSTITLLYPYRTFAIAAEIPRGEVVDALYWDLEDPYHYIRVQPVDAATNLLIVGGEDYKTGQANDGASRFHALETWAKKRWPAMRDVRYRWSGQVFETPDGLGLLGLNPGQGDNSFMISGDSGHGMTHATLGALIITDRILGRAHRYESIYAPRRFNWKSTGEWLKENANVGRQYLDWLAPGEVASSADIAPGEGAVIRKGASFVAVHKDEQGKVKACSAVCTHLGGIVKWNSLEKSWDCPCHGSRFSPDGKVIATPALTNLKVVSAKDL